MGIFSDAQGQLTLQSVVESGQISNSSELSYMVKTLQKSSSSEPAINSIITCKYDKVDKPEDQWSCKVHLISWPSKVQKILPNLENIW